MTFIKILPKEVYFNSIFNRKICVYCSYEINNWYSIDDININKNGYSDLY